VFIVTAEYDSPYLDVYGLELAHRLGELHKQCAAHHAHDEAQPHLARRAFPYLRGNFGLEIVDFIERA